MQIEMVEFSICAVPANPEALITGRALKRLPARLLKQVREEFAEFSHKVFVDKLKRNAAR
jgi:hypothetical protein